MSEQQCSDMQQLHSCVARLHQLMEEERSLIQRHPSPSSHAGELPAEFCTYSTATDMNLRNQDAESSFNFYISVLHYRLCSSM